MRVMPFFRGGVEIIKPWRYARPNLMVFCPIPFNRICVMESGFSHSLSSSLSKTMHTQACLGEKRMIYLNAKAGTQRGNKISPCKIEKTNPRGLYFLFRKLQFLLLKNYNCTILFVSLYFELHVTICLIISPR